MHARIFNIREEIKQQGPTIQPRELYSVSSDKPEWKRIQTRMYIYIYVCIYITESLWYTAETNKIL